MQQPAYVYMVVADALVQCGRHAISSHHADTTFTIVVYAVYRMTQISLKHTVRKRLVTRGLSL